MTSSQKKPGRRASASCLPVCSQCKKCVALGEAQVNCVLCEKAFHRDTCSMLTADAKLAFRKCGPDLHFLCTGCRVRLPELRQSIRAPLSPTTDAPTTTPPTSNVPAVVKVATQATATDTQSDPPAFHGRVVTFSGYQDPLSNHYPAPITYHGKAYPTLEHAYLEWKAYELGAPSKLLQAIAAAPTAGKAKFISRSIPTDDAARLAEWNDKKVALMEELLQLKLASSAAFRKRLRATGGALLAEALPTAGVDPFWSTYLDPASTLAVKGRFPGSNMMGRLLMKVRSTMGPDTDGDDATVPTAAQPARQQHHHHQQQQQQQQQRHRPGQQSCNRCGERGHPTTRCWHPQPIACRSCGTTGHKAKMCRGGPQPAHLGMNFQPHQPMPLFNNGQFLVPSYGNYYA